MIQVVCALIVHEDRILVVQHGKKKEHPDRWEFPGGKINRGESEQEALRREILEELDAEVNILLRLEEVDYSYPGKTVRLIPYLCQLPQNHFYLKEHQGFLWLEPERLAGTDMLEADRLILDNGFNFSRLLKCCRKDMEKGAYHDTPGND